MVEKVAGQQEGAGGGEWLPLLRPLFVLLRKVSQMEVEETAYKMTLLLNVLKVLLTTASNEDLKNVDQSQVNISSFPCAASLFGTFRLVRLTPSC